jgi:hypothetical protein
MDAWLLIRQAEALPAGVIFAAGAVSAVLVQYAAVVFRRLLARRRAARTAPYPVRDPRRLRADAARLREACDVSAANLETGMARLKQLALERVREHAHTAAEVHDLRRALAEKAAVIADLEGAKAEMVLASEKHRLDFRRQADELRARADGLAAAQQTIALMRDMLDRPERAGAAPSRAAR